MSERKKDAYYFPHDSNAKDDPKCVILIETMGLEGYGIYWILLEILRDQSDYKYPIAAIPGIARRYGTTVEKVKVVIEKYGLFDIDEEMFFSPAFMRRMLLIDKHRQILSENGKKGRLKQLGLPSGPAQATPGQVKESKVNQIKENETDWQRWGDGIVEGRDQFWQQMNGRRVSRFEMDQFISVAVRNNWTMDTQQKFRLSLKGFSANATEQPKQGGGPV